MPEQASAFPGWTARAWGVVLGGAALYSALFYLTYPFWGRGLAPFSALWVLAAGWSFGPRGGIMAGFMILPWHLALFSWVRDPGPAYPALLPATLLGVILGGGTGWARLLLERARAAEARYQRLLYHLPVGVGVHDGARLLYANPELARILGAPTPKALVGRPLTEFIPEAYRPQMQRRLEALRSGRTAVVSATYRLRRLDGTLIPAEVSGQRVPFGHTEAYQVVVRDLSEETALRTRLEHLTYRDAVTGLPNRNYLKLTARQVLEQAQRRGWVVAAILIDLNGFHSINEGFGVHVGDRVLRAVAEALQATVRAEDLVAHLGADEFLVLAQDCTPETALRLVQRYLTALEGPYTVDGHRAYVTATAGVALYPEHGTALDALLAAASAALREARGQGVPVRLHTPAQGGSPAPERLELEIELRQAMAARALELHYQPIRNLRTGRIAGAEALVRWPHPERGWIPPGAFIPLAEERGLMPELDRYVLRRALAEMARVPGWCAVNLSPQTLHDPGFVPFIREALEVSRVPPGRLVLEITERMLADPERILPVLQAIKELGVGLAVDDFGTGYSSLTYLRLFPLDHLKLDQRFTHGLTRSTQDTALVEGILDLARRLGIEVIAEGVETPEQLEWLKAHACDYAQGYLIARPGPLEALDALARREGS
ncbi:putative bifunctional diguanylate cyclase/phosphodiesterase [Marinithermus hydrothermalis]|uniref:Diguanylate cyclase/phosphodiesterase with PAS/PAC sensor(S) n=1 Tax=Marinithermus hydrothermalis (strain DSM 14884 / JCM 11576 / T1) TaxID=869210 RepID=F2NQ46_MARHT|nr:bifunctional diguanylate cyclase/phosphodiesterase [Marinithermus hydrothermalis]AEB11357.1 diguanylate cyclase/phosphodiesterase with PAS/PAC sensor(s) [Marinithermus hydrothermalis DSM 14884]